MMDLTPLTVKKLVVEEHVSFSLSARVAEGLLQPTGARPSDWRFSGAALPQARRALRLARELDLDWAAVVLVTNLLAEIDRLRSRLQS